MFTGSRMTYLSCALVLMLSSGCVFSSASNDHVALHSDGYTKIAPRHFLRTDKGPLAYRDSSGHGPVILLLHPMTGSDDTWKKQYETLAGAGFRVLGLTLRGAGLSGELPLLPHNDNDDILALLEHLSLRKVHLAGSAAGGINALRFAVEHSDRLESLVISNSFAGLSAAELKTLSASFLPPSTMPPQLKELGPSYRYSALNGNKQDLALWQEIYEDSRSKKLSTLEPKELTLWRTQVLRSLATETEIKNLTQPVMLIYGGADLLMPPPLGRKIATLFSNAQVIVIPEAGHAAQWEFPEVFNAALIDFYKKLPL